MSTAERSLRLRIAVLVGLALSGAVAAFATIVESPDAALLLPRETQVEALPIDASAALLRVPDRYLREEHFNRGDTVAALLARLGIAEDEVARLGRHAALRTLRAGLTVTAEVGGSGELFHLNFLSGRDLLVTLARDGESWRASAVPAPLDARVLMKAGTIRSSLFGAADAAGVPDGVAIQLADIFGGDIDFHRDLRRGDRFAVVYEMSFLHGRAIRSGRVLSAEFVNQGRELRAIYHFGEDSDGKKAGGYYTPDGKNLRKAFLRSPLEFSRISSGFGMRMHPFLQTWRAHKGIDYAAPPGTRVRAVGDAVVEFAGRQGGYGNLVILRHHGQYASVYAHLSGFAAGVRKGARLAQGDAVGFVGQTGWATGPHLHYEFRIAGEARNPLSVAMPAALPVPPHAMAAFRRHADPLVTRLDLIKQANLALLE